MSQKDVSAIIRLRKDTLANYELIENQFTPKSGEVCIVDIGDNKIRAKVGDGEKSFKTLHYADEYLDEQINKVVTCGYYIDGNFYRDPEGTVECEKKWNRVYVNLGPNNPYKGVYVCKEAEDPHTGEVELVYQEVTQNLPYASSGAPGILRMYGTLGDNEDGTMTQAAITRELNKKAEIELVK